MANQLIGWGAISLRCCWVESGRQPDNNCGRGDHSSPENESFVAGANYQNHRHMDNGVADIVEVCAEETPNLQFARKNAIEVVHDIVEKEKGDQKTIPVLHEEESHRQDAENRRHVGQVPINNVSCGSSHALASNGAQIG